MTRFFFDVTDQGCTVADTDGLDMPDVEVARRAALETLGGIARDELPTGDRREFVITVRDGTGERLRARLTVTVEWCGAAP